MWEPVSRVFADIPVFCCREPGGRQVDHGMQKQLIDKYVLKVLASDRSFVQISLESPPRTRGSVAYETSDLHCFWWTGRLDVVDRNN